MNKIFPNSTSYKIKDMEIWKDPKGESIGWMYKNVFYLRKEYTWAYEAYKKLLKFDIDVKVIDIADSLYGEPDLK